MIVCILCHSFFHYFHKGTVLNGRGDLIVIFGMFKHTTRSVTLLWCVVVGDLDSTGSLFYIEQIRARLKKYWLLGPLICLWTL